MASWVFNILRWFDFFNRWPTIFNRRPASFTRTIPAWRTMWPISSLTWRPAISRFVIFFLAAWFAISASWTIFPFPAWEPLLPISAWRPISPFWNRRASLIAFFHRLIFSWSWRSLSYWWNFFRRRRVPSYWWKFFSQHRRFPSFIYKLSLRFACLLYQNFDFWYPFRSPFNKNVSFS